MAELITLVPEFTVCDSVAVETSSDNELVETLDSTVVTVAVMCSVSDDWRLLPGTPYVRLEVVPTNAGYESTPRTIRANAIPNPAVAMGRSGNLKESQLCALYSLIVLAFRTVVLC